MHKSLKRLVFLVVILIVFVPQAFGNEQEVGCRIRIIFDRAYVTWSGVVGDVNPDDYGSEGIANVKVHLTRLDGSVWKFRSEMPYIRVGNRLEVPAEWGSLRGANSPLDIPEEVFREEFGHTPDIRCHLD